MNNIKLFESKTVRSQYNEEESKWYFSVIDIISVLTNITNPIDYWFKMKMRVKTEGGLKLSISCRQLKLKKVAV
jgi:DNA-damage-inducible protein D